MATRMASFDSIADPRAIPFANSGGSLRYEGFKNGKVHSSNVAPMRRTMSPMVTGSSVLGLKFNGGVVLAADMLGSYGSMARFPNVSRISKVNDTTVFGASGDYADFQFLGEVIELMMIDNDVLEDGHGFTPKSIFSWLRVFMYSRRTDFNPLWNTVLVAGYDKGESFLGYVDKLGVSYTDDTMATGYGAYIARPLLRNGCESNPNMTEEEAVKLVTDCLRVLYYRDARSLNKYEIAVVTESGCTIKSDLQIDSNWEIAHMIKGYE